jgi:hypothetical protein
MEVTTKKYDDGHVEVEVTDDGQVVAGMRVRAIPSQGNFTSVKYAVEWRVREERDKPEDDTQTFRMGQERAVVPRGIGVKT